MIKNIIELYMNLEKYFDYITNRYEELYKET